MCELPEQRIIRALQDYYLVAVEYEQSRYREAWQLRRWWTWAGLQAWLVVWGHRVHVWRARRCLQAWVQMLAHDARMDRDGGWFVSQAWTTMPDRNTFEFETRQQIADEVLGAGWREQVESRGTN